MEFLGLFWNFITQPSTLGHGSQRSALRLSVAPSVTAPVQPVQSPVTAEARAAQEAAEKMVAEGVLCSTGGDRLGESMKAKAKSN